MIVPSERLGLILVAVSTLAWSTAGLFTRAISENLTTVIVWRGTFGCLGLLIVLLALQGPAGLRGFARLGAAGWLYAAISGTGMLCYITALRMTSIAHVSIIYAVVPFLTAGLAWAMLGERPSRDSVIASLAAFFGAVVMVGLSSEGSLAGDALALVMTLGMALMVVIARKHPQIPTLPAGITSAAISVVLCLPFGVDLSPATDQLLLMAGFGLVNSSVGFSLFLLGSTMIKPIQTALIGALEAPIAPLWVWIMFGETVGPATLIGAAIILIAVIWHITRQYREPS
jgi:drug/metabolite transporter (DMT)-like permease